MDEKEIKKQIYSIMWEVFVVGGEVAKIGSFKERIDMRESMCNEYTDEILALFRRP